MKIVQIVPGSGNIFFCQNCVRDLSLIRALRDQGHTVSIAPMYLPISAYDSAAETESPLFFGAVKTYLAQRYPLMRHLPRWMERKLDAPGVLQTAIRKARTVRARGLEEMTLAMLLGERGPHVRELDRMVEWIATHEKPDVIHLSNALLLGLARRMKQRIGCRLVCSLQDEDTWVDAMRGDFRERIWQALSERTADVDAFIAVSHYYAGVMAQRLTLPPARVSVVYPGVEPPIFHQANLSFRPPVVGYVSRMSESLGLGVLFEAFFRLKQDRELRHLRLRVTGGHTADDLPFLRTLHERITQLNHTNDVDFQPDFDKKRRLDFLQSLSVFSVPVPSGEAFGLEVLEAIASGVPVVQPDVGSFRELIDQTGGGVLYDPTDVELYIEAMRSLLSDPDRAREMGRAGREAALRIFTVTRMASETARVYAGSTVPGGTGT